MVSSTGLCGEQAGQQLRGLRPVAWWCDTQEGPGPSLEMGALGPGSRVHNMRAGSGAIGSATAVQPSLFLRLKGGRGRTPCWEVRA